LFGAADSDRCVGRVAFDPQQGQWILGLCGAGFGFGFGSGEATLRLRLKPGVDVFDCAFALRKSVWRARKLADQFRKGAANAGGCLGASVDFFGRSEACFGGRSTPWQPQMAASESVDSWIVFAT